MKKVIAAAGLILSLGLGSVGLAQSFSVFPALESPDFPSLDTDLVIQGAAGNSYEFTGNMMVRSAGIEGTEGPQGWSFGVSHDKVDLVESTYYGTPSEQADRGGFAVLEIIEPGKNGGKNGIVEAIVLHFKKPIYLPPNTDQIVAINKYKATIPATPEDVDATIKFEEGLVGSGQPVACNVTYKGNTFVPALGERKFKLHCTDCLVLTETICDDGLDNDGDQKTDCCDEDCAAVAPCGPETVEAGKCTDGKDNDCDGKTDAADEGCVVPPETACADGQDNDGDQKTDCADEDCANATNCKPETDCKDGQDNDGDQQKDCDDDDCKGTPDCPVSTEGFDLIMNAEGTTRQGLKNVLKIAAPYEGKDVDSTAYIGPTGGVAQPEGAQGWSVSVNNDAKLEIVDVTTVGTDAMAKFANGFEATEVVDPAKNEGKEGWVSAIVLSFKKPNALDPDKEQSIALAKYKVEQGTVEGDLPLVVRYLDNLKGTGQPVPNVITVKGDTVFATNLISLELQAGPPGEVDCSDKQDNDGDQKTDCADEDCGSVPPCAVAQADFKRGDANNDTRVNIADPIWIINELVRQGPSTLCRDAADANDDGAVDLSDAMFLIDWRFRGQSAPPAPGPFACGPDTVADSLQCDQGSTQCP